VNSPSTPITSLATLMSALSGVGPRNLDLQTSVTCPYSITLPPGFSLTGRDKDRCVLSFSNGDGVGLTANNQVSGITIIAIPAPVPSTRRPECRTWAPSTFTISP
jgi:hypothetical protein